MAGPDPKRMYLAISSQNIESLKAEKPYWSKAFIFATPLGSGPKYTAFQAAMVLRKMKVVNFLVDQPSVDMSVKNSEGKTTIIIAIESKMSVSLIEKILRNVDLRCLSEVDSSGNGPMEYADPGSEVYEFLHSVGCKTKQEKEAVLAGFFGEKVKGAIPGISEHQRRCREGSTRNNNEKKGGKRFTSSSTEEVRKKSRSPETSESEDEESILWRDFDNIDALEAALKMYLDEWGDDHEEGKTCSHWLQMISSARENGKTERLLEKWNANFQNPTKSVENTGGDADGKGIKSKSSRGRSSKRSCSAENNADARLSRSEGASIESNAVDHEAVKLFFSGKAGDQVNLKPKGKAHRLTFVVASRSSSVAPRGKDEDEEND